MQIGRNFTRTLAKTLGNAYNMGMKFMIASDLHGSEKWTGKLLDAFERERAELLVLLGDLYYHGVRNPLPEGYAPLGVANLLNAHKERLLVLRGNCDSEVDLCVSEFPTVQNARLFADGRHFYFCHGHNECFEHPPALPAGSAFCQGHTHVAVCEKHGDLFFLNPGSVSLPKGGTPRGFALVSDGEICLKRLE